MIPLMTTQKRLSLFQSSLSLFKLEREKIAFSFYGSLRYDNTLRFALDDTIRFDTVKSATKDYDS